MYIHRAAEDLIRSIMENAKVTILLGARQVGKTTLIEPFVREKNGLLLNCDIDIDKTRLIAASKLESTEAMRLLGNPKLLVIDEAQNLPEVGKIVKGWYDAKVDTKIVLLGSSSLDLLDKTAEPLTGRNEKVFLTPLLFTEVLRSQSWFTYQITKKILQEQFSAQIQSLLLQQIVYGGYPESTITGDKEKYLLNLTSDYLLRDVLQSGLVKSPELIKKLLTSLAYQTGREVSTNELANNLQTSRATVERYLELLERSYVIFRIQAFSTNQRKEINKNTKFFFWDTGVRNALLKEFSVSPIRSDIGALFENWVIAEVAKANLTEGDKKNIYFWRKSDGGEVDLIVKGTDSFRAYEIKWTEQNTTPSARSFSSTYNVPIVIITKNTILELLWDEKKDIEKLQAFQA